MKIQFRCDFYIEYLNYAYHNVKMLSYKKFFFNCKYTTVWLL